MPTNLAGEGPAKKQAKDAGQTLTEFAANNRKTILIVLIIIVALIVCLIAGIYINRAVNESAISKVEDLASQYSSLQSEVKNNTAKAEDVKALLDKMLSAGKSHSGYTGARAYCLAGQLCADQKNWADAEKYYVLAAGKGKGIYLGSVAIYNAGEAAESAGKLTDAIAHYKAAAADKDFPGGAHAQFNVARLLEASDKKAAIDAYNAIATDWPNETNWINLAKSRTLALSMEK